MRASHSQSSAPQCCKESSPIRSASPPQSHSRSRLRVHANGSTGGRSSPHPDEIFHFAGNCYPRGQQPWEVLSLPVDPVGEVCPESHSRQRLPPPALPHYASGSYPLRGSSRLSKCFLTKMPSSRRALLGGWRPRELGGPLHGPLFEGLRLPPFET